MGHDVDGQVDENMENESLGTVTKLRLIKDLVWRGCETWTMKLEEKRSENKCIRKQFRIPRTNLMTTEQSTQGACWNRKRTAETH